jgi:hypothetical protein
VRPALFETEVFERRLPGEKANKIVHCRAMRGSGGKQRRRLDVRPFLLLNLPRLVHFPVPQRVLRGK